MPRTRFSAALYLILVFASGILVGIVSYRLYVTKTVAANTAPAPRSIEEIRHRYLEDMRAKVGVTDSQIASITQILDDTKRKFDDLHHHEKPLRDKIQQDQVESIRALLSDDQRTAYEKWRADRAKLAAAQKKNQQPKK